ncbi:MAG: hypothetical protein AMXMBFR56_77360 [Polyangiaceae bacterium]
MGRSMSFASHSFVRFTLTFALAGAAAVAAMPACSSGEDFTGTGGGSNTGGSSGDASTTGGQGGSGGSSGSAGTAGSAGGGGVAGTGTGGVAGTGTGGDAGSSGGGTGGNPSGKDNGQACANKTECKSNYCVDDVCCESECVGDCRSCKVSGKEGECTPYTQGTDPEGDCVGAGAPTDPCAGTCDGKSACAYPDSSKSCGAQVCTNATQTAYACDKAGACKSDPKPCDPYQCSGTSCLTTCSADTQCLNAFWCDTPKCVTKLSLGAVCPKDSACQSGTCVVGNCCAGACGPNFSCETGNCQCNGQTCGTGEACVFWYQDADADGFGNAGVKKLGCATKTPTGYVANSTDCDDGDKDAFPGQTKYFTVPRKGKGGYDYNCDNTESQQYPIVNAATCKICASSTFCPVDTTPPCTSAAFSCEAFTACPGIGIGFLTPGVACGAKGTAKLCTQQTFQVSPGVIACSTTNTKVDDLLDTPQACR